MAFVKTVGYDEFVVKLNYYGGNYNEIIIEKYGGTYRRESDYLIPNLSLPVGERPVGVYGQRHLQYLQEHRRLTYTNLLTSGKLNQYLCEIDEQAQRRFEWLLMQMKQQQCITEQLKK